MLILGSRELLDASWLYTILAIFVITPLIYGFIAGIAGVLSFVSMFISNSKKAPKYSALVIFVFYGIDLCITIIKDLIASGIDFRTLIVSIFSIVISIAIFGVFIISSLGVIDND